MSVSTFVLDNAAIQLSENGITLAVFSGFIDCTKPDGLCGGKTDLHKGSIISDANTLHNQVFGIQNKLRQSRISPVLIGIENKQARQSVNCEVYSCESNNACFDSQGIRFAHFGDDTPCQRELARQTITESISRVISKRSAK
jgi:hypothetical protein